MQSLLTGLAGIAAANVTRKLKRKARDTELYVVAGVFLGTAWVLVVAGVVLLLAPVWGWPWAVFAVAGAMLLFAGTVFGVVRHLAARDRERDRNSSSGLGALGMMAALKMLPGLRMPRRKAPLLLAGLAIAVGVALVSTLGGDDDDEA